MPAVVIFTLVVVGLIVAALAFYLTWVVLLLRDIHDTLGKVAFGVRAIAYRTSPLRPVIDEINGNLIPVADALEALVARLRPPAKTKAKAKAKL